MHQSERGREGGFSLIEVVLVVMLMGIIAALAIPHFPTIPKKEWVARGLIRDIRYAKALANRTQTMSGVFFFNCTGGVCTSYRVFENNDTNDATIDPLTGGSFEVNLSGNLSGVKIIHGLVGATLKFDSVGTPFEDLPPSNTPLTAPPPNNISVTYSGETITVRVVPNIGKVYVQ